MLEDSNIHCEDSWYSVARTLSMTLRLVKMHQHTVLNLAAKGTHESEEKAGQMEMTPPPPRPPRLL